MERLARHTTTTRLAGSSMVVAAVLAGCSMAPSSDHADGPAARVEMSTSAKAGRDPSDIVPPTVTTAHPVHDSRLAGVVTLSADAADDVGVTQVRWFVDGAQIGFDDDGPPWQLTWNTAGTADGPHVVVTKALDVGGNWGTSPAVGTWVDNDQLRSAVDTAVTGGQRAANSPTPTFEFVASRADASFQCRLDGMDALPCSSPLTLPALPDGAHTLLVTAVAPTGESDPSPAEVPFVVDTSAPSVVLGAPVPAEIVSGQVTLVAHASDNSDITAVRWYVDGVDVAYDGDGAPWTRPWDTATVPDGRHRIFAKARDAAGNWGTSMSVVVTVSNSTAPTALLAG